MEHLSLLFLIVEAGFVIRLTAMVEYKLKNIFLWNAK